MVLQVNIDVNKKAVKIKKGRETEDELAATALKGDGIQTDAAEIQRGFIIKTFHWLSTQEDERVIIQKIISKQILLDPKPFLSGLVNIVSAEVNETSARCRTENVLHQTDEVRFLSSGSIF